MLNRRPISIASGVCALASVPALLQADCTELRWRDGLQVAHGFDSPPTAAASIDHDGDGVPTLFVAGSGHASGIGFSGLVHLVDGRWQPFGQSFTGTVRRFLRFDVDGDGVPTLVLLGFLRLETNGPQYGMLEWSGSSWIGRSSDRRLSDAVVLDDDGDGTPSLIASVLYTSTPGVSPLVRWTPSGWAPLTSGYTLSFADSSGFAPLETHDSDGDGTMELFARVNVSQSGVSIASGMARWNGTVWASASGSGTSGPLGASSVLALCAVDIDRNGSRELVAVRSPNASAGGTQQVVAYDGASWQPVGGTFLNGSSSSGSSAYLTHASAVDFGDGAGPSLVVSGQFDRVGATPVANIARWDGSGWGELGGGLARREYTVLAVSHDLDGDSAPELVAFGGFNRAGGAPVSRAATFDGSSWSPVGTTAATLGLNAYVRTSVRFDHDGDGVDSLIACGYFTMAGSTAAASIAAFDGTAWEPIANPWPNGVEAMLVADLDGDGVPSLYAAGNTGAPIGAQGGVYTIAVFAPSKSGGNWTQLGASFNASIETLSANDHDLDGQKSLFAGGYFWQYDGASIVQLVRWTGASWTGTSPGNSTWVNSAVMFDDDGDGVPSLVVGLGGNDPNSVFQRVRKWNGAVWSNVGTITRGHVFRLQVFDHDGDGVESLFAFGQLITPSGAIDRAFRCQSGTWIPFGPVAATTSDSYQAGVGLVRFDDDGDGMESLFLQTFDPFTRKYAALHRQAASGWEMVASNLGGGGVDVGVVMDLEGDGTRSLHLSVFRSSQDGAIGSSYFGIIDPCASACPADLDGSGSVDSADLAVVLSAWGPCSGVCAADLDASGEVDSADLGALLAAWGGCP
jgi:hypothetical protein